jgi:leader peptidase (prepilin peptidase)/N-methyltransferase
MTLLLGLLLVLGALSALAGGLRLRWADRGMNPTGPWPLTLLAAATVGMLTGVLTAAQQPLPVVLAATAAGWLAVLATSTDLRSRMIPREACHAVSVIGLLAALATADALGWLNLAVTAVALVALPWVARALTRQGLGFGDIRMLAAFTATLGWWLDPAVLIYALIGACLLQLAVRLAIRLAKVAPWRTGATGPAPARTSDLDSLTPAPSRTGAGTDPPAPFDASPSQPAAAVLTASTTAPDPGAPRRAREMPFGPALAVSYLAVLLASPAALAWRNLCGG